MDKKIIYFGVLSIFMGIFFVSPVFSQSPVVDCQATIHAWENDISLRGYMATHTCTCPGPVCTPISSGLSPSVHSGSGQDMQMIQSILQPFFNNLFAPPDISAQDEIDRQNAIKLEQENAKKKQAAIQAWIDLQNEEALKREMEKNAKVKQGEKLLSQMQTVGIGGKLEPFSIGGDPKLDIKPLSQPYSTAHLTEWQRLLCSAYFSNMAKQSTKNIDASFYADQAQRVMSAEPTYLECRIPEVDNEKMAMRMEDVKKVYEAMNEKMKDLRGIEDRLIQTREKIKDAESKKEEATTKLNELQGRSTTASPEEKAEVDLLVLEAQKQLQDAGQELDQAKESEKDALNKKERLENELGNMRSLAQARIQAGASNENIVK